MSILADFKEFLPNKGRRREIYEKIVSRCRIDSNFHAPDGSLCWLWDGSDSGTGRGGGYGRMALDGATMAVHRVMFIIIYGPIAHKKQIDHICHHRRCCNPKHLEQVTHKENQKRRDQKNGNSN